MHIVDLYGVVKFMNFFFWKIISIRIKKNKKNMDNMGVNKGKIC